MRNLRHSLLASTPTLAIPAWAKFARITGIGGGGGGANSVDPPYDGAAMRIPTGGGGGAGGSVRDVLIPIAAGVTSVGVVVGAAGVGGAAGSNTRGTAGGDSTITIGARLVTLAGGKGGGILSGGVVNADMFGAGGDAFFGPTTDGSFRPMDNILGLRSLPNLASGMPGMLGSDGGHVGTSVGAGGYSSYGRGGYGALAENVAANRVGSAAEGYGAGGGGGNGTGAGGNGSPGLVIIEFLEAV